MNKHSRDICILFGEIPSRQLWSLFIKRTPAGRPVMPAALKALAWLRRGRSFTQGQCCHPPSNPMTSGGSRKEPFVEKGGNSCCIIRL